MKKLLQLIGFMIIATSCSSKKGNDNNPEVSVVSVNPPSAVSEIISTINSGSISFSLNSDADTEEISLYLDDHCSTLIKTIAGSDLKNQVTVTVQENQNTKIYGKAKKNNTESACTLTTTIKYWPNDTFTASYTNNNTLVACDGTQNLTQSLTSCIGDNTGISDNSKCTATTSLSYQSPAGGKNITIDGGIRVDNCAIGSSVVTSNSYNCDSGYIYGSNACNKIPVINTNGIIYTTVLDSVNNRLYIGGSFSSVNGVSKKGVAALNATTGDVIQEFSTNIYGGAELVNKLILVGTTLYLAGEFTYINSVGNSMSDVAAVNTSDGSAVSGFLNTNLVNTVFDMVYDAGYLYAVGNAHKFSGGFITGLIKINAATGAVDNTYTIGNFISGTAYVITKFGTKLYIGGNFTAISSQNRNAIAAIEVSTGVLDSSFVPDISSTNTLSINSIEVSDTDIFVAGSFDHVSSQPLVNIAKLNPTTGVKVSSFNPPSPDSVATRIYYKSNRLFVGGYFNNIGSNSRIGVAELNSTTGEVTAFNTGSSLSETVGVTQTNCYPNNLLNVGNLLMISHENCSFNNSWVSFLTGSTSRTNP